MAHRILLREVVIDVPTRDLDAATAFWAGALATEARPLKDYAEFVELDGSRELSASCCPAPT